MQLEKEKSAHQSVIKELEDIQVEYEKLKESTFVCDINSYDNNYATHLSLTIVVLLTASAKAFDQYGEMVGRYEKQLELKEKAESLATSVSYRMI